MYILLLCSPRTLLLSDSSRLSLLINSRRMWRLFISTRVQFQRGMQIFRIECVHVCARWHTAGFSRASAERLQALRGRRFSHLFSCYNARLPPGATRPNACPACWVVPGCHLLVCSPIACTSPVVSCSRNSKDLEPDKACEARVWMRIKWHQFDFQWSTGCSPMIRNDQQSCRSCDRLKVGWEV
jgi:hypothetical protein